MAESMYDMMDAFSSAFQKRQGRDNDHAYGGSQGQSDWPPGASSWGAVTPPFGNGGMPWGPGGIPMSPGNMSGLPFLPRYPSQGFPAFDSWRPYDSGQRRLSTTVELDGDWLGRSGERLSVRDGRFRIYQNPSSFREGYLRIRDNNLLTMQVAGRELRYEYAVQGDRLVLRDEFQQMLLYRRVNARSAYGR